MRHFPATRFHPRIEGISVSPSRPVPLTRRRSFWFAVGFFACGTLAGHLAGLLP